MTAFQFGPYRYHPATGELVGERTTLRLAPQPALVLSLLLEHAGDLVTRDALRQRLWPNTIVEFDKGLNFCIREVRAALDDNALSPKYVETLPRRGYRFVAAVQRVSIDPPGPAAARPIRSGRPVRARSIILAGLALLCVVALMEWARSGVRAPDPRARELIEMGGFLLRRGNQVDVARSVSFFRRALALDPGYARAYGGLGTAFIQLARADEGKAALRRSLELDPRLWASHLNLALQASYVDYDRRAADMHFRRALALARNQVVVRHTYAWFLAVSGNMNGALKQMRAALQLDPVSPRVNGDVGRLFYLAGRQNEAVAQCRRTQELLPDALGPRNCVIHALVQKAAYGEARMEALATLLSRGADDHLVARVRASDSLTALDTYWRWAATVIGTSADDTGDSHVYAAAAWARAGEPDSAFAQLQSAFKLHCQVLPQVAIDPAFAGIHDDPRYSDLLGRIGALGRDPVEDPPR